MNGRISVFLSVVLLVFSCSVLAKPVGKDAARGAAKKWLRLNPKPMGRGISRKIKSERSLTDPNGLELCHVFDLDQGGFVIVSSDDMIEPVIAFSQKGIFDASNKNPLVVILRRDMPQRLKHVRKQKAQKSGKKNPRWKSLQKLESSGSVLKLSESSISDVRVDSFLPTRWSQEKAAGDYCYNYYTPEHYPCGCVATAMGQVMRYHQWPQTGIGTKTFTIEVNDDQTSATTMGGDGSGGAYDWSLMPYVPSNGLTTPERQAIGRLLHDAGTAVEMSYHQDGSGAYLSNASIQIVETFKFSNSIFAGEYSSSWNSSRWTILNSNMNAKLPVILGILDDHGGHAVVADGYGFNGETQYHHLNMGWGGYDDAWYNLPTVDSTYYNFDVFSHCMYNVYTTGSGEIISGRVAGITGDPIVGVSVKAYYDGSVVAETVSDDRGIYALEKLPSNRQYKIVAAMDGYSFDDRDVSVGKSTDDTACANKWDIDFLSTEQSPPVVNDATFAIEPIGSTDIELSAADEGFPKPSQISFVVVSLPQHGSISDPAAGKGAIESVPYTLANNSKVIRYTPCPYYAGQDTIKFQADDGGTAPDGGLSNIGTLTFDIDTNIYSEMGVDSDTFFYGFMLNTESYYAAKTQVIYLKSEIGGPREITDISIRIKPAPGGTLNNFTVRMQNTNISAFYNPSRQFLATGWTTVYQEDLTIEEEGWLELKLDEPFMYNGVQHLMIDFTFSNDTLTYPKGGYYVYDGRATRSMTLMSDSQSHEDPLLWDHWQGKSYSTGSEVPSIKFYGTSAAELIGGDIDLNCSVYLVDFVEMVKAWGSQQGDENYDERCDLATPKNSKIDIADLAVMMDDWLYNYWD